MTTAMRVTPTSDPRAYQRWVRRQKGYGRWQPLVDAEPARKHVKQVLNEARLGYRRYAELAGVPRTTLTALLYGVKGREIKRITPDNERKLLAVQADAARGLTVPAVGSQRRIHVLIGEGWPQIHLGPHIGTHTHYVWQILHQQRVTLATAEAVTEAYQQLAGVDPLRAGVTSHGYALAKRLADRNNWPDRTYWDDMGRIDDLNFNPDKPPSRDELAEIRREEVIHFARFGYEPREIHERLGGELGLSTIQSIVREHRTGQRRDRRKPVAA